MKKNINLITFNLNKDINFNKHYKIKNILIGDWCNLQKNYYIKNKLDNLNFYNLNNTRQRSSDAKEIENLYKSLLIIITKNFNLLHKQNLTTRSWEIIVGRWLHTFISDAYARWQIISKLKKKYKLNIFYKLNLKDNIFIPENTVHYRMMPRQYHQYYPHFLFSKIIEFMKLNNKQTIKINCNLTKIKKELEKSKEEEFVYGMLSKSLSKDIFLYKSSLDRKIVLSLFKNYLFVNYPLEKKIYKISNKKNISLRNKLHQKLISENKKSSNDLKNFILEILHLTIPKSFVENFFKIKKISNNMHWPTNPNYILTSYAHYNDEIFKSYCAQKIMNGTKIYVFQHGAGGIFKDRDFFGLRSDLNAADKILSWGKNIKENSKPFFYSKQILSEKNFYFNKKNKILFLLYQLNENVIFPPDGFLSRDKINRLMFKNLLELTNRLNNKLVNKIHAKILQDIGMKSFENSIEKSGLKIKLLNSKVKFEEVINNYNIAVNFRISTVFFECLIRNKPTILVLDKKTNIHFDKKFSHFLKLMLKNNIAFTNISKASKFINDNYFHLDKWWNNKKTQKLRNDICENYCRNFNSNHKDFKNLFKN